MMITIFSSTTGYISVNQPVNNGSQSLVVPVRPSPEYMALLEKLERVQEERRQEAITAAAKIATLEERLRALEESQAGQQADTSPAKPAQPLETPVARLHPQKRPSLWQRMLGGGR